MNRNGEDGIWWTVRIVLIMAFVLIGVVIGQTTAEQRDIVAPDVPCEWPNVSVMCVNHQVWVGLEIEGFTKSFGPYWDCTYDQQTDAWG